MRNLKRVLSLALALVMVLGMMVITTSAADFADADEITNKEAVEVLSELGILVGDNGKFNPNGNLNRAGAAKLIAFMTMGAEADNYLTGSAAPFEDVTANHWAAKYVAYCANLKIINGNGDGTFNPDGNISTVGFAKLVLGAAGIEGTYTGDGWEQNVKNALEKAELDVIAIDNTDITREEAAALMLAGLKYAPTAAGWVVKGGAAELKTFTDYADAVVYAATLNNLTDGSDFVVAPVAASGYLLDTVYDVTYADSTDEYKRPGIRYTGKDIDLFYADEALETYVNTFDADAVKALTDAKYTFAADVWYNGDILVAADDNLPADETDLYTDKGAVNGYTVELYATGKTIDTIVVTEYNYAVVGKVTEAVAKTKTPAEVAISVYDANGQEVKLTVVDDEKKSDDMFDVLSAYAEKDSVLVAVKQDFEKNTAKGAEYILDVADVTTVEGKVSKVVVGDYRCTSTLTIDGETYGANNQFAAVKNLVPGDEGTLYLDAQGNGIFWGTETPSTPDAEIVYIAAIYAVTTAAGTDEYGDPTGGSTKYYAQCVTQDGEVVSYLTEDSTPRTVGALREISFYEKEVNKATVEYAKFAVPTTTNTTTATLTDKAVKIANNQYFTEDVKFIYVTGTKGDIKVEVKEGVQALTNAPVEYVIKGKPTDTNKTVPVVFVEAAYVEGTSASVEGVVYANEAANSTTKVLYTEKEVDKTGYEHTVYVDGVETTIVTDSATKLDGFVTMTEIVAGVYKVETVDLSKATNLLAATKVANMYNGLLTTSGIVEDMAVAGAALVDVSGDKDATDDATKLTDEYTVALVLSADKKSIVTIYITDYTPKA